MSLSPCGDLGEIQMVAVNGAHGSRCHAVPNAVRKEATRGRRPLTKQPQESHESSACFSFISEAMGNPDIKAC